MHIDASEGFIRLTQESIRWGIGLAVGLPLVMVGLTEAVNRLRRRGHPLANTVGALRTLVVPAVGIMLFLEKVSLFPPDHPITLWAQTFAWIFSLYAALVFINDVVFGRAATGSWQARVPSLVRDLARVSLVTIGGAIIYSRVWGQELQGAVTALGLTSIVIGLALQEPLGNIISGLMLMFERPINIGDVVNADGVTGKVTEINWRSVHLSTRWDGIRVVPNSTLYKSSFNIVGRPKMPTVSKIELGFSYDDPPNFVKGILLDLIRTTPGISDTPIPTVYTVNYADFSIVYRVTYGVDEKSDFQEVRDSFMSKVWYAAKRNGLTIPFPIQTEIQVDGDLAAANPKVRPVDCLLALPQFRKMDLKIDERLEAGLSLRYFGKGELAVKEGQRIEGLHAIVKGRARLTIQTADKLQHEVATIGRGEVFGENAALTGQESELTVTAVDDLEVLVVNPDAVYRLMDQMPRLSRDLGDVIDNRRRTASAMRRARYEAPSGQ